MRHNEQQLRDNTRKFVISTLSKASGKTPPEEIITQTVEKIVKVVFRVRHGAQELIKKHDWKRC